jgi:hypothetical protein
MPSEALTLILSGVIGLVLVSAIAWLVFRFLRSRKLRQKFGREYDYAVEKAGSQQLAEEALIEREKRINQLELRPLNPAEWERYHSEWVEIQADFVDDPGGSVEKADRLVSEIMILRGFSIADFEQRIADLSVLYPEIVSHYRIGHATALKGRDGGASTEELREAIVLYRDVVEHLMRTETVEGEKEAAAEKVPA